MEGRRGRAASELNWGRVIKILIDLIQMHPNGLIV